MPGWLKACNQRRHCRRRGDKPRLIRQVLRLAIAMEIPWQRPPLPQRRGNAARRDHCPIGKGGKFSLTKPAHVATGSQPLAMQGRIHRRGARFFHLIAGGKADAE